VAIAYLRHFGARSQAVVQHERIRRILDVSASQKLFATLDKPSASFKLSLVLGALRHFNQLRGQGRRRFYLNIGHTGLHSNGFRQWVLSANVRPIYFVHDLIPITHPQFCRAGEDERHRERMKTVLQTASGVIGNSQVTLDELARFAHSEQLKMPPALAAWLGTDPLPRAAAPSAVDRTTFVALGTIEARKNHLLLLNIWSRLIDRLGSKAPRLVIIGGRGWEAQAVFDLLDHSEKLRGHVIELENCSDEELAQHLATARALLFPSLSEGYGLPLVEALAMGVPVIASDLPVFREIGGEIPAYLNPNDEKGWEAAILDYADGNSPSRAAQLERMRGFQAPSWKSHFDKVERWLGSLN
jgi:glycosyltransferase involved in cell wall biosynthesis